MKNTVIKRFVLPLLILLLILLIWPVTGASGQVLNPGPNVNVSVRAGNQMEATVAVNPNNPLQVFVSSNDESLGATGLFAARSADGGITWTRVSIATGAAGDGLPGACCDPSAAWDQFGNLFLTYLNGTGASQVEMLLSTNGGATFTSIGPIAASTTAIGVDQPSTVTTGGGAVWVTFRDSSGTISARGAAVTGLGTVGAFNAAQVAPGSAGGNFGDIAIGPTGQVMVTYQQPAIGQGPSTIFVNVDTDGLGPGGFGAQIAATATNVGGFDIIPAQSDRTIDAEAGLAFDRSGGPRNGRVYLVYTDETPAESNDTDILLRFSDSNGAAGSWSAPIRVNDDATNNSQFLPRIALDQSTGNLAISWYDARADGGTGPADGDGANNDAQLWGTWSINNGATFLPNVQISAGISDEDGGEPAAGGFLDTDFGDYDGADFAAGSFYTVWGDNSNSTGDNPNGTLSRYDVYISRVVLLEETDLSITKTDLPDPVVAGTNLTYTLTVTNNGPSDATGVVATDTLPAGVTLVSATPSQGSCTLTTCNLGNLASGASATVTIVVNVASSTACGSTLTNSVSVTGNETDPNAANNTATANTAVICQTDLSITKNDSPDPIHTNTQLTYTISVSNDGPSDASGVAITDPLPTGVVFVSTTASQGSCTEASGTVTCNLGNLSSGDHATVSIVVKPTLGGTITNTATVSGNETDPDNSNNRDNTSTIVILVVSIDIKPGNPNNPINPRSEGEVVVAILSTRDFDAPGDIDQTSLTFGKTGEEMSLVSCMKNARDVNHDGLPDLVCHFYTQIAGFAAGSTEGLLKGTTHDGILFEGKDAIRIVPK